MKCTFFISCFILLFNLSFSQWKQNEFVIGTFADPRITYDRNEAKDSLSFVKAKNAYINLLTGPQYYMGSRDFSMMDRTLKLAEKFGMKLLVIDSRMRIADPSFNEDTAMKIISHFKSLNSKAFEGYYLLGEVPQKNIEQVNRWTPFFKKNDPDKLVYYYLLPYYAFNSKNSYEAYVNALISDKSNSSDVVAYDYYPFTKNGAIRSTYFYNLKLISKAAGSRPFWSYVLSTSTPNFSDPTAYQLSFSVFCPLAYGAKGIIYFTYETIPEKNNLKFGEALIDANGNPTKKYAIVKNINQYLAKVLGPVIMNSTRIGTYHISKNSDNETLDNSQVLHSNFLSIAGNNILIGIFKSNTSSSRYLLAVNKKNDTVRNVQFSLKGNFISTVKMYPRMNELTGSAVVPKKMNAGYRSGKTGFTIDKFLPGEAILIEF